MAERPIPQEFQPFLREEEVAEKLLSLGAISVETDKTFTWSSGIESPVYSDMRLIISDAQTRWRIANLLAYEVGYMQEIEELGGIAGTATAGIPHAALVAERLHLPMVYVRSQSKDHGKGNQIEGRVKEGERYVVIEDLISTGESSINSAKALRDAGAICENIVSIFDYNLPVSQEKARLENLTLSSLTNFPTIVNVAFDKGLWSDEQIEIAVDWYKALQDGEIKTLSFNSSK